MIFSFYFDINMDPNKNPDLADLNMFLIDIG